MYTDSGVLVGDVSSEWLEKRTESISLSTHYKWMLYKFHEKVSKVPWEFLRSEVSLTLFPPLS